MIACLARVQHLRELRRHRHIHVVRDLPASKLTRVRPATQDRFQAVHFGQHLRLGVPCVDLAVRHDLKLERGAEHVFVVDDASRRAARAPAGPEPDGRANSRIRKSSHRRRVEVCEPVHLGRGD